MAMLNRSSGGNSLMSLILRAVLASCLVTTVTGCMGLDKADNAPMALTSSGSTGGSSVSGAAAFQATFYPFIRTNCSACHGQSQAPMFAPTDATSAYSAAKSVTNVNFANPSSSEFIQRANDGHCAVASCTGNGATALAAFTPWANAEIAALKSTGSAPPVAVLAPKYMTEPQTVPSILPNVMASGLPTVMRWPLNQMTPTNSLVDSTVFEVEVLLTNPTTYRFFNPRIIGNTGLVEVSGIHLWLKAQGDKCIGTEYTSGANWAKLDATAQISTMPSPLPTGPVTSATLLSKAGSEALVINTNASPPNDLVAIGFDNFKVGLPTATASFASINTSILTPYCLSCHSAAAAGSQGGGVNLSSYSAVMNYVQANNPANSTLYTDVTGGSPKMPKGGASPLDAVQTKAISDWITAGALNN